MGEGEDEGEGVGWGKIEGGRIITVYGELKGEGESAREEARMGEGEAAGQGEELYIYRTGSRHVRRQAESF